jgi:hypothetical protein
MDPALACGVMKEEKVTEAPPPVEVRPTETPGTLVVVVYVQFK